MAEDAWLNLSSSSSSDGSSDGSNAAAATTSSGTAADSVFLSGWSAPEPQWSSMTQVREGC